MGWLRLILLLAGALFVGLLFWWERRRPHQAARDAGAPRAARSQPVIDLHGDPDDAESAVLGPARELDAGRAPPLIDWSAAAAPPDHEPAMYATDSHAPAAETAAAPEAAPPGAVTDLPPLVLDWPPEAQRHIFNLRILPARQDRLAGRALRLGLTGCGFRHGPFGIFHLALDDGRVLLSAASLVRPGMLDPAQMDFQRFSGINVFAVLPGPTSAEVALEQLAAVTAELAARVDGRVQEESGAPYEAAAFAQWRSRCLASLTAQEPAG